MPVRAALSLPMNSFARCGFCTAWFSAPPVPHDGTHSRKQVITQKSPISLEHRTGLTRWSPTCVLVSQVGFTERALFTQIVFSAPERKNSLPPLNLE